ncbi:MAG TPA: zinc-binding dehydrogenase, partial [Gemmatimonadaceae bacterium]|nr:zinc-binding dehydrogenase [Gemmatimonadaceae bacterium]
AEVARTRLLKPIIGRPVGVGGVDITYVTASNARGIEDAMRFTREGGTIVLIGNATTLNGVDWTPLWLKELRIQGTLAYGVHGAASGNAFNAAARLIEEKKVNLRPLVTHKFSLADVRSGLAAARSKGGEKSVKVVLQP